MKKRGRRKSRAGSAKRRAAKRPARHRLRRFRLALIVAGSTAGGIVAGAVLALGLVLPATRDGSWLDELPFQAEFPAAGEWVRSAPFTLKRVVFRGLGTLEGETLVEWADLASEQPLIDVDTDAVEQRLEAHPRVASALALRLPPDRLIVRIDERLPVAILRQSGEGVDDTGARFPLEPGEAAGLAAITGDAPAQDLIHWTLPALEAARQAEIAVVSARALGPGDILLRAQGSAFDLRVALDPARALREFGALRASGILERVPVRTADLRFSGQAVLQESEVH